VVPGKHVACPGLVPDPVWAGQGNVTADAVGAHPIMLRTINPGYRNFYHGMHLILISVAATTKRATEEIRNRLMRKQRKVKGDHDTEVEKWPSMSGSPTTNSTRERRAVGSV
jgi:hypothetical protein